MANFGKKAQGALEYLLIIGGAIVLAAIIVAVVFNLSGKTTDTADTKFDDFNTLVNDPANYGKTVTVPQDEFSQKAAMIAFGDSYRNFAKINDTPYTVANPAKLSELYAEYIKRNGYMADLNTYRYQSACKDKINLNCVPFTADLITKFDLGNTKLRDWFYAGYTSGVPPTVNWETLNKCIKDDKIKDCFSGNKYNDMSTKTLTLN